jgi:4-amino-4-deoxy-L-arabinose transferase-like glycosyltransferase
MSPPLPLSPSPPLPRPPLLLITLLAFWLRLPGLFGNSFHADEALFATWARYIATWRDPLLLTQAVDKPPLLFYLQAPFYLYPVLGPAEMAGRMPNFIASILLVPLVGVWGWRLYGGWITAVLPSLLLALSPFAIQFSATAFTDPLLVFCVGSRLLACCRLQVAGRRIQETGNRQPRNRPLATGLLFGLAAATKYQAWLVLAAVGGVGLAEWLAGREWRRFALGLLPVLALLLAWDVARTGSFSLWAAQMGNYGGLRPIWSWELWPRFTGWLALAQYLFASPFWSLLALAALLWPFFQKDRSQTHNSQSGPPPTIQTSQFLSLFLLAYLLLHWFLAIPVWDRYLLPLLPIIAVLIGGMVNSQWSMVNGQRGRVALFVISSLLIVNLFSSALDGRNGRFPIGGSPQADGGAGQVAALLYDAPYGTVLYDHWYSWQWNYHLFWRRVHVNWVPHPAALAEDLRVFGSDGSPRYIVLPRDGRARPFQRAVSEVGFRLIPVDGAEAAAMQLYRVMNEE